MSDAEKILDWQHAYFRREAELEAQRNHAYWHLLHAEAERDDALWTLERVNGRAQVGELPAYAGPLWDALRDIRAYCERGLRR